MPPEDPNSNWLSIWLLTLLALWFIALEWASRNDVDSDGPEYQPPTYDTTHTEYME